ncbi:histidinol-phosphate aminotransferase family protein [Candidatus Woesearchaeota archaeon]|nr:histidinol-phosphate aminotransferase family protein [Candidatus Woesearchaeota archaeon]
MKFRSSLHREGGVANYAHMAKKARIQLDLTTNPLGCPDAAWRALMVVQAPEISQYAPSLEEVRMRLARRSGLRTEEILLTAGADQAIEIVLDHLLDPGDVIGIHVPTFPRFEIVAASICDAKVTCFSDLARVPECKAVVFCTPNNPTTLEIPLQDIRSIAHAHPEIWIIVDSVFAEFGSQDVSALVRDFENAIVLKSLSKSFGLAGLRIGWIEARQETLVMLQEGISPFRVPIVCQRAALAALNDPGHILRTLEFLDKQFVLIKSAVGDSVVRTSNVPFYLFMTDEPVRAREWLLGKDISVVDSTAFKGSSHGFLRIMIGTAAENQEVIDALKAWMALVPH